VRIWDPKTGQLRNVLHGHPEGVWPVVISGELIATGGDDGVVRVWSAGELLHELPGHTPPIYSAVFLPDLLVTGDYTGTIRVWDLSSGRVGRELRGNGDPVYRLAASPDHRVLASGDAKGRLCLWNPYTGEPLHRLTGHSRAIYPSGRPPARLR